MLALSVFPAHAGMNRLGPLLLLLLRGVPRACGDEPALDGFQMFSLECSPRMRG